MVDLHPLKGGKFEQRFRIELRVQNPNDFELEIDGLDFELDLNGTRLTRGLSDEAVTIPRLGDAIVAVSADTVSCCRWTNRWRRRPSTCPAAP